MKTEKLTTTDGFVVFDLEDAPRAMGLVRLAPKVLVDGAVWLARSVTYQFASFEVQAGGASGAINARPDGRDQAVAAFVAEVAPWVSSGRFLPLPGKGVTTTDLEPLRSSDPRPASWFDEAPSLLAVGVAAAAERATGSLDGRTVAIEGFDVTSGAVARELAARGARVVAVGTTSGTALAAGGFEIATLEAALSERGTDLPHALGTDVGPPAAVLGAEADIVCVGSKAGVIDHTAATEVRAGLVVPTGPIPVTAKALAQLTRQGVVVLPDFVTTAGPALAAVAPAEQAPDAVRASVAEQVPAVVGELLGRDEGPFLAACLRAEAFLSSWRDQLPFGRPLA